MSSALFNVLPEAKHVPAAQRLRTPKTNAIPLLTSYVAKYYSHTHTVQIMACYYFRAGALVKDPLSTMIQDLIPLAVTQALFCAVCLPSVGSWDSGTDAGEFIKGSASKNPKHGGTPKKKAGISGSKTTTKSSTAADVRDVMGSWPSRFLSAAFALVMAIALPTVPLMVLALVLGAPLYPTSLLPHTLVLALHVSLLGTLPLFYTHGVSATAWWDVSAAWLPFDEAGVWAGTVGAMVGGWVGAVPMALDWDREWQKWPCTVLWGVVIGWGVARLLTNLLRVGIGTRIDMTVTEYIQPNSTVTNTDPKKID